MLLLFFNEKKNLFLENNAYSQHVYYILQVIHTVAVHYYNGMEWMIIFAYCDVTVRLVKL